MKMFFSILALCILLLPVSGFGQEETASETETKRAVSLYRIADDMKFNNGVQFIRLKKYAKAIEELEEYLEIYCDGIHRSEAWNRLAGLFFERMDYLKALSYYKRLYEESGAGEEGASACYSIALCYTKMGFDKDAVSMFRHLMREYPASHYSSMAKDQLHIINMLNE